jgi:hypothetical protein
MINLREFERMRLWPNRGATPDLYGVAEEFFKVLSCNSRFPGRDPKKTPSKKVQNYVTAPIEPVIVCH